MLPAESWDRAGMILTFGFVPLFARGLVYTKEILVIGNTIVGDILKDGFVVNEDNPLRKELFILDESDTIRKRYGIKRVIITHLEEDWGKTYDGLEIPL